jgi:hypothetical protein
LERELEQANRDIASMKEDLARERQLIETKVTAAAFVER